MYWHMALDALHGADYWVVDCGSEPANRLQNSKAVYLSSTTSIMPIHQWHACSPYLWLVRGTWGIQNSCVVWSVPLCLLNPTSWLFTNKFILRCSGYRLKLLRKHVFNFIGCDFTEWQPFWLPPRKQSRHSNPRNSIQIIRQNYISYESNKVNWDTFIGRKYELPKNPNIIIKWFTRMDKMVHSLSKAALFFRWLWRFNYFSTEIQSTTIFNDDRGNRFISCACWCPFDLTYNILEND